MRLVQGHTKETGNRNAPAIGMSYQPAEHVEALIHFLEATIPEEGGFPVQAVEALGVARGCGSHVFRHPAHRWLQGCQPYAPAAFYPQENSWYSFLSAAESPGP
jgi:hypothetical protein